MADRVLREACEHGRYGSCDSFITNGVPISSDGIKHPVFSWKPCPGDREVTIDYEAAANIIALHSFDREWDRLASDTKTSLVASALEIVDAALRED